MDDKEAEKTFRFVTPEGVTFHGTLKPTGKSYPWRQVRYTVPHEQSDRFIALLKGEAAEIERG